MEAPIVHIARSILCQAIEAGASEIHIEPGADRMAVFFQIGGALQRIPHLSLQADFQPRLVARYKVLAETGWASKDRPVKGHFAVSHDGKHYDLDLVFAATPLGEKVIISITAGSDARPGDYVISGPDRPI